MERKSNPSIFYMLNLLLKIK